ncbi:MAG: hypothetical protein AAGF01_11795 [Cyanobacteria bacterium P01_G01_bin.38]
MIVAVDTIFLGGKQGFTLQDYRDQKLVSRKPLGIGCAFFDGVDEVFFEGGVAFNFDRGFLGPFCLSGAVR